MAVEDSGGVFAPPNPLPHPAVPAGWPGDPVWPRPTLAEQQTGYWHSLGDRYLYYFGIPHALTQRFYEIRKLWETVPKGGYPYSTSGDTDPQYQPSPQEAALVDEGFAIYQQMRQYPLFARYQKEQSDQSFISEYAPFIFAAIATYGVASAAAAGAGAAAAAAEGGAVALGVEGSAAIAAPGVAGSGAPLMFSAEAAAVEAAAAAYAPATAQLAQFTAAPTMFSAEAAAAQAFGGAYLTTSAAPAAAGLGLSELASGVRAAQSAASQVLGVGRAARALLGGDAPVAGADGFAGGPGDAGPAADTFLLDLVWTVGTLVAGLLFFRMARG